MNLSVNELVVDRDAPSSPVNERGATLLLYVPVALHREGGTLYLEAQACNGLRLWADHFDRLIVMMPLAPGPPPPNWVPLEEVGPALERIDVEPLPLAYRPDKFVRALPATRARIRKLVARADYLSFSIGGLAGDWGSVGCLSAHAMGRPFAVWTDRVEHQVVRNTAAQRSAGGRLRAAVSAPLMERYERYVIKRAALGLFHGRDTFESYAPLCRNPHLVHDIHLKPSEHIGADRLAEKLAEVHAGPLRIVYAGRADPMKGPLDWVDVLAQLARREIAFEASWLGDGSDRPAMQKRLAEEGLGDRVTLPGHLEDRGAILEALRSAHIFLFCHKTPESPRCLIEALASGTPIVGYDSAYGRDLVASHGGGRFVARGDVDGLAEVVASLCSDRAMLGDLIRRARDDGAPFTDEAVFEHRSMLIKENLPRRGAAEMSAPTGEAA